jgi:hypothetical protein
MSSRKDLLKRIVEFIDNLSKDCLWVIADHSSDSNLDLELSFDYSFDGCSSFEELVLHISQWEYVYVYDYGFGEHDGVQLYPYWDGSLRLRLFYKDVDDEMLEGLVDEFKEEDD